MATAEAKGESSQFAEVKDIWLALDTAECQKWPVFYVCTDSWMVANALWEWVQQWKQNNWQCRGKSIWAAELWQDISAQVENLVVKVCHAGAHVPFEKHQNNQNVDQVAKIEVSEVDLDWQHKGDLFVAQEAHDTSVRSVSIRMGVISITLPNAAWMAATFSLQKTQLYWCTAWLEEDTHLDSLLIYDSICTQNSTRVCKNSSSLLANSQQTQQIDCMHVHCL